MAMNMLFPRQEAIDFNGPTIPAPAGQVSNVINPPNGNKIALAIISICVIVSAVLYMMRLYAKILTKQINVGDYLTLITFPLYWVYIYYSYRLSWSPGYLIHEWNVAIKDIPEFSYVCYVATCLYLWLIALIKIAILCDWTCIFASKGQRGFFAWTCFLTCGAVASLAIILFVMDLVNCTPFDRNYNPLLPGSCRWSVPEESIVSAAANFALDALPLILAQRMIWGLHTTWGKKLGVSLIFLVGVIGMISSIVRLYYAVSFYRDSADTTYFFSIVALCTLCEITCANLVLCLPFAPKAIKGFKQTKTFLEIKSYMTSSKGSSVSESREGSGVPAQVAESPRQGSAEKKWFGLGLRESGEGTLYEDSVDEESSLGRGSERAIHLSA
ncbi:uncharacterized protein LY89DRAFT_689922 [Mollisia scopiformis]|uniref:Rhodopsin domain-containing protein n=1 Tax=Mollisia scopiformis TaxID=149040 RepID=A0A132BCV6_MOLSC|nr:uncharacterized protein LY89DRAFT_689922 [Mollisia scopiformis]KUJ10083.1 hypothetical protein LY89DRAFT_689922 [Mollisia scopiformis]